MIKFTVTTTTNTFVLTMPNANVPNSERLMMLFNQIEEVGVNLDTDVLHIEIESLGSKANPNLVIEEIAKLPGVIKVADELLAQIGDDNGL